MTCTFVYLFEWIWFLSGCACLRCKRNEYLCGLSFLPTHIYLYAPIQIRDTAMFSVESNLNNEIFVYFWQIPFSCRILNVECRYVCRTIISDCIWVQFMAGKTIRQHKLCSFPISAMKYWISSWVTSSHHCSANSEHNGERNLYLYIEFQPTDEPIAIRPHRISQPKKNMEFFATFCRLFGCRNVCYVFDFVMHMTSTRRWH